MVDVKLEYPDFAVSDVTRLTQECRKRVEAFESAQQKARQWETYFTNFQQQQQVTPAQVEEFRGYLSTYQTWWTSCQVLDPKAQLAMFCELECSLMQEKDLLSAIMTKWKNDQALAQIGKPSNAHELQQNAIGFAKLDNKACDAIGLVRRFQRFAHERSQLGSLTELGPFWQEVGQECSVLASRIISLRRELQRESFLVFEQPPYIVRRSSGKTKAADVGEEKASEEESGDEKPMEQNCDEEGGMEIKCGAPSSRSRSHHSTSNATEQTPPKKSTPKRDQKVVFDLRVRLMVGDKGHISDSTKVHAVLLTDQQCRELQNRHLTAYDDPLAALDEIGPPVTAAATNGRSAASKRKIAKARRRTPRLPGTPPFAAGHLSPYEAPLTFDSSLEHFEAFFQNMKVNEKDRNPEVDAQSRFYRILFVTKLKDWEAKDFYLWCLSLPFPIVVNATRQERSTSAKIFCHLALSAALDPLEGSRSCQPSRLQSPTSPASIPPHCPSVCSGAGDQRFISWPEFFDRLNWWWVKQTGTKKDLRPHELFLACKLGLPLASLDIASIALEQVTKKYDGLDFSFWDWLFMIAHYVKRNVAYWDCGFVLGFVSKEQINPYLARAKEPVMFIRFSESALGSLVISYGMAGREPQHIILLQKKELKQHKLTFFIQHSKQLLSVNYVATSLNPASTLKHKSEFFQLENAVKSEGDDENEPWSRRGYTKPRLAFDWSEPPPPNDFGMSPASVEHDDDLSRSSLNLEELLQAEPFDKGASYTYDDLAADPNGFSTALVANRQMAYTSEQGPSAWSGGQTGSVPPNGYFATTM